MMIRLIVFGIVLSTSLAASFLSLGAWCNGGSNIVKISARRFEYSPGEITLKKGVPVVLQLSSEDRAHGFNISEMNLRADIEPGKITELKLTPQKAGEFNVFCDVFCGSGHERMHGKIIVVE